MSIDRRQLLSLGLASGVVAATGAAVATEQPQNKLQDAMKGLQLVFGGKPTGGLKDLALDYQEQSQQFDEPNELLRYAKECAAITPWTTTGGISVPFASVPVSMYYRRPADDDLLLTVPEPKIPQLVKSLLSSHLFPASATADAQDACRFLLRQATAFMCIEPQPPRVHIEVTDKFDYSKFADADRPLRLVTPRYVVDLDERHVGPRMFANMLIWSVVGLVTEMQHTIQTSYAANTTAGIAEPILHLQRTDINVVIKRDGFMFEMFMYQNVLGSWTSPLSPLQSPDRIPISPPERGLAR